jgi:Fe-S oxidoreductase
MGIFDTLKKYKWIIPIITSAERDVKRTVLKNLRKKKDYFYPTGEYNADVKNLINCMLCPNMCRFDCGTLQASCSETMSPAYKSRIGYYLSMGKIDPKDPSNKEFIDLMYQCTNEENCKIWCPFEFSVVSLLETVRDDLNEKGLMPDYCRKQIDKLKKTGTIEKENVYLTYKEKGIENIETRGNDEVFYYVGCQSFKFPEAIKTNIELLKKADITFSTNFERKVCCGAPAFNIRDKETINTLMEKNQNLIEKTGASIIVSDCPGCVDTLKNRYRKRDNELEPKIVHIVEYFGDLIEKGKLEFTKELPDKLKKITIHDPCLLARNLNNTESIRTILKAIPGIEILEPVQNKESTHCCGWSGTAHWANKDLSIKEAHNRINELKDSGTSIIVTACPTCELGLNYGISEDDKENVKVIDISELLGYVL